MSFLNLANFWQSIKRDRLLLLALFLGLALRGLNPTFGSPSLYISNDEAVAHLSAFNMIVQKTSVSIANYTPLGAYMQIPFLIGSYFLMIFLKLVPSISGFELFILTHEGYFLFVPRLISAFFGTLTILVVYKITTELFRSKSTAIIAAFLTAVSFNLVHISHFGRPWAASLFFFILSAYFFLKNRTVSSMLSVALSYGFHQAGILAFPLILWRAIKKPSRGNIAGFFLMSCLIALFSFLTLRTGLIESIRQDQSFLKQGKLLADLISGNFDLVRSTMRTLWGNLSIYFTVNLLVTDGIIFVLGVFGLLKYRKLKNAKKELILFISTYFIFASLFFHPLIRYLLPILILLIPFSAWSINFLFSSKKYLVLIILVIASINAVWWNLLYIKKPTFIMASDWISQNIPAEVPVAFVGGRYKTFAPTTKAILHMQEEDENLYGRLLELQPNSNLDNVRNIIYVSYFSGNSKLEQLEHASFDYPVLYVVDYYNNPRDRLFNLDPDRFDIVAQFKPTRSGEIVRAAEPLFDASWNFPTHNFSGGQTMYSLVDTGPFVEILKLKNN